MLAKCIPLALVLVMALGCDKPAAPPNTITPEKSETPAQKSTGIVINRAVFPSIVFEAEAGKLTAPMALYKDDDKASAGAYVLAPEGPNHQEMSVGGGVTIKFNVAKPGDYTLWLRSRWCCGCGNSVDVLFDGKDPQTVGEDATYGAWHWVEMDKGKVNLTEGPHLLTILNREDGSAVDQVLLTQDPEYRPSEIEAPDVAGRTAGVTPEPEAKPPARLPPPPPPDGYDAVIR